MITEKDAFYASECARVAALQVDHLRDETDEIERRIMLDSIELLLRNSLRRVAKWREEL